MHRRRAISNTKHNSTSHPSAPTDSLDRVGQACQAALFDYIDAISFSSGTLARMASEPEPDLSIDEVLVILAANEEQAHEAFRNARAALIEQVRSRSGRGASF